MKIKKSISNNLEAKFGRVIYPGLVAKERLLVKI